MNTPTTSDKTTETTKQETQPIKQNIETIKDKKSANEPKPNDETRPERKYRRDFSRPINLPEPDAEPKKLSIEEEFDKFFAKYKNPALDRYKSPSSEKSIDLTKYSTDRTDTNGVSKTDTEDDKLKAKPPRKSRFLRPDFYDTPPEESKYVIKNEKVRAFRERSLSRQRELARNRSTDSFGVHGSPVNDYVRSKTCSLSDKIEGVKKRESYRRTISEDHGKLDLSRSGSRSDVESEFQYPSVSTSHSKSLILQNELENEIRKTKNMNSKLSGLMMALNDNENQYEKKLERLYGLKSKSEPVVEVNGAAKDEQPENANNVENKEEPAKPLDKKFTYDKSYEKKLDRLYGLKTRSSFSELETPEPSTSSVLVKKPTTSNGLAEKKDEPGKLALLEKKFAYFKKLQNSSDHKEKTEKKDDKETSESGIGSTENSDLKVSASGTSTASFDNDSSSLTTPPEEVDSDAWSVMSDSADSQNLDSINDRIRRRSFYSRFNIYKQKSTPNTQKSRPLAYSRSLSADYRQRSVSSSRPV